jgi:hypothetical protein
MNLRVCHASAKTRRALGNVIQSAGGSTLPHFTITIKLVLFQLEAIDPLQNQQCRVCEEPAAGFHFGAFTCEGCKSFFGRTCNNQSVIQECKNNYR